MKGNNHNNTKNQIDPATNKITKYFNNPSDKINSTNAIQNSKIQVAQKNRKKTITDI